MPIWKRVGSALTKAAKFTSTRRFKVTAKDGDNCKRVTFTVRGVDEADAIAEAKDKYDTKRYSDFKVKNPMAKKKSAKKNCSTKARNGKKTAKKSKKNPAKVTIRRDGVTKTLYGAAANKVLASRKAKTKNAAKRKNAVSKKVTTKPKAKRNAPAPRALVVVKGTGSKSAEAVLKARGYRVVSNWADGNLFAKGNRFFKIAHPVWQGNDVRLMPTKAPAKRNAAAFTKQTPASVKSHKRDASPTSPKASYVGKYYQQLPGGRAATPAEIKKLKAVAATKNASKKNPRKSVRRNPEAGALYSTFTGQPHTGYDIVSAPNGTPANVDQLGEFLRFKWVDWDGNKYSVELEKQDIPALLGVSRNKDGYDTLYALGDFVLPMEPGDHGFITRIEYRAQKLHLGDTAPRVYYHDLGEETGEPPIFHVDKEGRLHFKAGAYWVEDRGIVN